MEDFAIVDEVEQHAHSRQRFTVDTSRRQSQKEIIMAEHTPPTAHPLC